MLEIISISIIPFMILIIVIHGYVKGVDIYSAFIEGAKEGMKTTFRIVPYLIAIFIAIGILKFQCLRYAYRLNSTSDGFFIYT